MLEQKHIFQASDSSGPPSGAMFEENRPKCAFELSIFLRARPISIRHTKKSNIPWERPRSLKPGPDLDTFGGAFVIKVPEVDGDIHPEEWLGYQDFAPAPADVAEYPQSSCRVASNR
jgi:hypothetical protein